MSSNNYKDAGPEHIESLSETQRHRLLHSKTFCMLPWMHLHARPNGSAYPCCVGNWNHPVGNLKQKTMREIWNDTDMREMRQAMLNDKPCKQCTTCYEHEAAGSISMRNNANVTFEKHSSIVDQTLPDGTAPDMKLYYWDIRFSNICNLKCRSCDVVFSSRWYDDTIKLWPDQSNTTLRVQFPGKYEDDMWEQIQEHIAFVEQIYFAGGEPLIMKEHNKLLKLLIANNNTQVKLIYTTNFSELRYKQENVLDLWKHFPNITVYASLDDMGHRGELIRHGLDWKTIEQNIIELKQLCPHIYFIVHPTLSILNVWNICNFHRRMIEQGFINARDLKINILIEPEEYRIDILPLVVKQELQQEFLKHIEWLKSVDGVQPALNVFEQRALNGFESAINFMMGKDNSHLIKQFWETTSALDQLRGENTLATIPELHKISLEQCLDY